MKKILALILFFTIMHTSNAQDGAVAGIQSQFKINLITPGLVYEHKLSENNTLYSEIGLGVGFRKNSYIGTAWSFYPYINEQFRHYYNVQKRIEKGKSIKKNSAGYIAGVGIYTFKSFSNNQYILPAAPRLIVAPVWGFQKTYKGNFNVDFQAGPAYVTDKYDSEFDLVINLTLGWVIGK